MLFYRAVLPLSSRTLNFAAGLIRRHLKATGSRWRKLEPARCAPEESQGHYLRAAVRAAGAVEHLRHIRVRLPLTIRVLIPDFHLLRLDDRPVDRSGAAHPQRRRTDLALTVLAYSTNGVPHEPSARPALK